MVTKWVVLKHFSPGEKAEITFGLGNILCTPYENFLLSLCKNSAEPTLHNSLYKLYRVSAERSMQKLYINFTQYLCERTGKHVRFRIGFTFQLYDSLRCREGFGYTTVPFHGVTILPFSDRHWTRLETASQVTHDTAHTFYNSNINIGKVLRSPLCHFQALLLSKTRKDHRNMSLVSVLPEEGQKYPQPRLKLALIPPMVKRSQSAD